MLSGTPCVLSRRLPDQRHRWRSNQTNQLIALFPFMTPIKLLLLPGDGIGPEVMAEVKRIVAWLEKAGRAKFEVEEDLVGGCAYDAHGEAISDAAMAKAKAADAVLMGAVGGPAWAKRATRQRPEAGLLHLRSDMGVFANLRPALCFAALATPRR